MAALYTNNINIRQWPDGLLGEVAQPSDSRSDESRLDATTPLLDLDHQLFRKRAFMTERNAVM